MKIIKQIAFALFPVFMLFAADSSIAQQTPSLVLGGYERMAVLDHIDFPARQVIIGGQSYNLAEGIKWYGLEPGSRPEEQQQRFYKKRVGYALSGSSKNPAVSAIWILSY